MILEAQFNPTNLRFGRHMGSKRVIQKDRDCSDQRHIECELVGSQIEKSGALSHRSSSASKKRPDLSRFPGIIASTNKLAAARATGPVFVPYGGRQVDV